MNVKFYCYIYQLSKMLYVYLNHLCLSRCSYEQRAPNYLHQKNNYITVRLLFLPHVLKLFFLVIYFQRVSVVWNMKATSFLCEGEYTNKSVILNMQFQITSAGYD